MSYPDRPASAAADSGSATKVLTINSNVTTAEIDAQWFTDLPTKSCGDNETKNVAETNASLVDPLPGSSGGFKSSKVAITTTNAYPGYIANCPAFIRNNGKEPVRVAGLTFKPFGKDGTGNLTTCDTVVTMAPPDFVSFTTALTTCNQLIVQVIDGAGQINQGQSDVFTIELLVLKAAQKGTKYEFQLQFCVELAINTNQCATGTGEVLTINGTVCTGPDAGVCLTPPPTDTPTVTATDTATATPTDTATPTPTDTPTPTPTSTPTATPTSTSTSTPTATATPTPTATPSPNTPVGQSDVVDLGSGLTVTFDKVIGAGNTAVVTSSMGPPPPSGFRLGNPPVYYDISTTATFTGVVEVCITYDDDSFTPAVENKLRLRHRVDSAWVDATSSLDPDTNIICAKVTNFSLFLPVELIPEEDFDQDGCSNAAELDANEVAGGQRDPHNFWDFAEQWVGVPLAKNGTVTVGDLGAVVVRFGTFQGLNLTEEETIAEALTQPVAQTGYHASADRSGSGGPNPWNLLPPNGTITVSDLGVVVAQFGHFCL